MIIILRKFGTNLETINLYICYEIMYNRTTKNMEYTIMTKYKIMHNNNNKNTQKQRKNAFISYLYLS